MAPKKKISEEDLREKKLRFEKVADTLEDIHMEDFLKNNFLPYSWSYCLDRALVDVTGLKPVHRHVLYTMFKDGLGPTSHHAVVATVAGRVLAFHPHGNVSVEDAIRNMGRFHVARVPLIDGSGNYGSPGKPGGAGRYIKARLSRAAWLNVEEIGEKAVSMVPNYDDTLEQPVKIPVRWPVAVINGGSGIAVGYASNMPSHNPTEVMEACKALVLNPDLSDEDLFKYIQGPDFNMGGVIPTNDGIKDYLLKGAGTFKIRGRYEVKPGPRSTSRIEFYEIPFGTDPEGIIVKIQSAIDQGRLQDVANYKNLSDLKHPIRLVIDTKPSSNPKKVLQELFQYTPLETSFSANMTTIVDSKPQQSPMRAILVDFLAFRKQCIFNKTAYALQKKSARLHVLEGLFKVLVDIDKAIAIIRKSEDAATANASLRTAFKIDEAQADYVLSLALRRLTKMDHVALEEEKAALVAEVEYLTSLTQDEEVFKAHLYKELDETLKVIKDERRTEINRLTQEEFKELEKSAGKELRNSDKNLPCYVTRFVDGTLLKTYEPFAYEEGTRKYEHSPMVEQVKMKTQENFVVVASNGMGYSVPLSYLPLDTPSPVENMGVAFAEGATLVAIGKNVIGRGDTGLMLASNRGDVKIVKPDLPTKEEFVVYSLPEGDRIIAGRWLGKSLAKTAFVSVSSGSNILVYDASVIRPTGTSAGGVKSHKLRDDEEVIYFGWLPEPKAADLFIISQADATLKLTPLSEIPPKSKGAMGVALHKFKKGEGKLVNASVGAHHAVSLAAMGAFVNLPPVSKRATTGVDFASMATVMGFTTVAPM